MTWAVTQMDRRGDPVSSYFIQVLPTEISAIDLAWDSNDAVEEYTVNFAVNYWVTKNTGANTSMSGEDALSWHIRGDKNGVTGGGIDAKIGKLRAIIGV